MKTLEKMRKEIDVIDEKIILFLAKRMSISKRIGMLKKEYKLSVFDKKRWHEVLEDKISKGEKAGLPKEFIHKLYSFIHKFSLKTQASG